MQNKFITTANLRKFLVTGILVWVPIIITISVIAWGMGILQAIFASVVDTAASVLPSDIADRIVFVKNIPGLGVILVLLVLLGTGMMAANFLGQWFLRIIDSALSRIPVIKSVYGSVKQVSDTLFSSNGQAFRKALLIQYPRVGTWTVAFQTGTPSGQIAQAIPYSCISVYVPTTPNPTSGFFLIVPRTDVVELSMSVDDALKYIISMGVVDLDLSDSQSDKHSVPSSALKESLISSTMNKTNGQA